MSEETIENLTIYLEIDQVPYVIAMSQDLLDETLEMLLAYSEADPGIMMYPLPLPLNFDEKAVKLH